MDMKAKEESLREEMKARDVAKVAAKEEEELRVLKAKLEKEFREVEVKEKEAEDLRVKNAEGRAKANYDAAMKAAKTPPVYNTTDGKPPRYVGGNLAPVNAK